MPVGKGDIVMKKTYNIDVDCANCALLMEEAAKKTEGVKDASVNFMLLKMAVEFEDGADEHKVMKQVLRNCRKVEDDCDIGCRQTGISQTIGESCARGGTVLLSSSYIT